MFWEGNMNEWLKKIIARLKNLWGKWSAVQKVIFFGIIGAAARTYSSCRIQLITEHGAAYHYTDYR